MNGKGSAPRPFSVSREEFAKRWEATLGKRKRIDGAQGQEQRQADEADRMPSGPAKHRRKLER